MFVIYTYFVFLYAKIVARALRLCAIYFSHAARSRSIPRFTPSTKTDPSQRREPTGRSARLYALRGHFLIELFRIHQRCAHLR